MNPAIKQRMLIYPLLYILLGVFLFFRQRSMIYFPTPEETHRYAEESVTHDGETIKVIVLNPGREHAIIYFGGNAETVIYNAYDFEQSFPGHTVYLFNYRGYGGSSGRPSEKGIGSDALALYDTIRSSHSSISAIGRSLGSGVAVHLAAARDLRRLALVTPFDSIRSVAQRRFLIYPMRLLLLDQYDSLRRVKDIKAPTLAIIAEHDSIIPRQHSLRLISAFPADQITTATIKDAGHNTLSDFPEYHQKLKDFFTPSSTDSSAP